MQELTNPEEIPVYLQALLNVVAFLISAVAVWYAYFIKGIKAAGKELGSDVSVSLPVDEGFIKRLGKDIARIADAIEAMRNIMQKGADEAEINRRVEERLAAERRVTK